MHGTHCIQMLLMSAQSCRSKASYCLLDKETFEHFATIKYKLLIARYGLYAANPRVGAPHAAELGCVGRQQCD